MATYRAARALTIAGTDYAVDDVVPDADQFPNLQRWLNLRFLKPSSAPLGYRAVRGLQVAGVTYAAGEAVPDADLWPNLHRWLQFRVIEPITAAVPVVARWKVAARVGTSLVTRWNVVEPPS